MLRAPIKDISNLQIASLASSFLSAGFILTSGMADFDLDPAMRSLAPTLHGFVPASSVRKTVMLVGALLFFVGYQACVTLAFASFGVVHGGALAVLPFVGMFVLYLLVQWLRDAFFFYICP